MGAVPPSVGDLPAAPFVGTGIGSRSLPPRDSAPGAHTTGVHLQDISSLHSGPH
jgi:hypothetical protein